jgi:hypothetical protein
MKTLSNTSCRRHPEVFGDWTHIYGRALNDCRWSIHEIEELIRQMEGADANKLEEVFFDRPLWIGEAAWGHRYAIVADVSQ